MIYSTTSTYRLSNQTAYSFKALDSEAATIYTITLDRHGEAVDPDLLLAAERAAYRALYGKLEPELSEWVRNASSSERKSVMVWVREPPGLPRITPPIPHSGVSQDAIDRYFAQIRSLREAQVASVVCPVADRCRERGLSVRYGRYVPVLYGDLTPSEVRMLESWEEVDSIGLVRDGVMFMDTARQTVRADVVEARGITGSGVKVAMVEFAPYTQPNAARVEVNNPHLTGTVDHGGSCTVSLHATLVAGIIRSTHPTVRGIAPDVQLWAGAVCAGNDIPLFEQAIDWGARVGNLSGGQPPTFSCHLNPECLCHPNTTEGLSLNDQLYDTLVFKNRFSVVASAGNGGASQACESGGFYVYGIVSPARAYNTIAVGAIDDLDTLAWNDDCLMALSIWCDPFSTNLDREKPEVVAPGASIKSTLTADPWVGCTTQACAHPPFPQVCGCRLNQSSCDFDYWGSKEYDCNSPSPDDIATINLVTGQRVRVAIVWLTDPSSNKYPEEPNADIDLLVVNSANQIVDKSTSCDNNFEIVDFVAPDSGTYKIRVLRNDCDTSYPPNYLAWAWWKE